MSIAPDRTTQYARDVALGRIVAGKLVRLAAERHLDDLVKGPSRGLVWDAKAADRAFSFFALLNLDRGRPFKLEPFQHFIVGSLFGWKIGDGMTQAPFCRTRHFKADRSVAVWFVEAKGRTKRRAA